MLSDVLVYGTHSAVLLFGALFCLWIVSVVVKDASLVDIFWGFGFVIVAATCLYLAPDMTPYFIALCGAPIIWGLRLSAYLGARNLGKGEDYRYQNMMKRAVKTGLSETKWRLRSLLTIYFGQGLLIMIISAPIWVGVATGLTNPEPIPDHIPDSLTQGDISASSQTAVTLGTWTIIGGLIWFIGYLFEAIGDWQLARFKKEHKNYSGPYADKPILNTGLWKYSRHPNYFGNALIWWGIWLMACQTPLGWVTIFAPLIMTILLTKISGRDLLERRLKTRKAYADYIRTTPSFFPRVPKN